MDSKITLLLAEFQAEIAKELDSAVADLTHELEIADIELTHEALS